VIETGHPAQQAGDDFFYVVVDALNLFLAEHGYDLLILPCHSADDPTAFLARTVARGTVDAIVITATRRLDPRIALLRDSRMPFLTLGRSETPGDYPWIDLDFEAAARTAVSKAAALGHRRIAVGLPDSDANLGFVYRRAYLAALAQFGLPTDERLIIRTPMSEAGGFALGHRIAALDPRPTALILSGEALTIGLYGGLQATGIVPGVDLAVVSFRDSPKLRFLVPAPARFQVDLPQLGRHLGQAVISLLKAIPEPGAHGRIVPLEWVPGMALCPPPGGQSPACPAPPPS
jgi:DNA-binding LacI/PurR family transcriptional regulator